MKSKTKAKKESLITYTAVIIIFLAFILFVFLVKKFSGNIPITGNAILETGSLNPDHLVAILIMLSVYAVIVCSYLAGTGRFKK